MLAKIISKVHVPLNLITTDTEGTHQRGVRNNLGTSRYDVIAEASLIVRSVVRVKSGASMSLRPRGGGGGAVLPYMGYIGMCGPKGYGFSAAWVIKKVPNVADSGHK